MTIQKWVQTIGGQDKAAKVLGVDRSTVSLWITQGVLPRPKTMIKIHKISNGKVSYKEMVTAAAN